MLHAQIFLGEYYEMAGVMIWGRLFKLQNWLRDRVYDRGLFERPIMKFECPTPFAKPRRCYEDLCLG
jgi:hypothetical protein